VFQIAQRHRRPGFNVYAWSDANRLMSCTKHHLLLIDNDPSHAEALQAALIDIVDGPAKFEWVRTLSAGLDRRNHREVWAIFVNLSLPDSQGADTFDRLRSLDTSPPIVVLGGVNEETTCQAAMQHGAQDYLLEGHIDSYSFARAIRKIGEREVAGRELFFEKERAQVTLNSIGDAVLSTDISGNVTYLNVVAETMTGWIRSEAEGHALTEVFQIIDGATHKPVSNPLELAIRENKTVKLTPNCVLVRRDGHEFAIEDSAAPIHDRDGQIRGAVIVFHDVSAARAMVMEMCHLAEHDALTDLPNRLLLNDRFTQAISMARRNQKRVAVLFLDLDGFKQINDSLGHTVGDKLLRSVAERLLTCVRKSDTVSRWGGDEYVILLSEVGQPEDAAVSATKIIAELKGEHSIGKYRLHITASIGISTYPEGGEEAETLIKNADMAMYHAKENGRDNYQFFEKEMNSRAVARQSLEGELRYALERDELLLHFQPKINLKTGAITSVEALVRWQHPERGLLQPGQFLAVAEDSGLILGIGRWVLREACRQMRAWLDAGLSAVPVAVNISPREFRSADFFESVRAALKQTDLDPKFLELEITEAVLMQNAASTSSALAELKAIGVRLAVDDFGTGYSSLSYLTRFPIDALKLDQSFVRNINVNKNDAIVARTIITMGRSLKLTVIAEGVETKEQLAFLQAAGCDEAQGYYFSRPVAAEQFARLLEAGVPATVLA
jgi:diguanylate cyclase (GGDEF)-like protein/PAS domain S-box-containing protein